MHMQGLLDQAHNPLHAQHVEWFSGALRHCSEDVHVAVLMDESASCAAAV